MSKKASQLILISSLLIIALTFGTGVGILAWIIKTAPDVSQLSRYRPSEASIIYSADGQVLSRLSIENRIYVPLSKIPMDLQNAVVAVEDQKFWEHNGINFWGILRAFYVDLKTRSFAQGASTITQQLARNMALHQKKILTRKIQEAYLAIQLERIYTKEEILEMYLNQIYLGHSAWGVQTAAQQYFGKDVKDLTLAECALIAGIIQSPNNLSPYNNMDKALKRRAVVLNLMVEEGYISKERAERAKKEPIRLAGLKRNNEEEIAPYFTRYVRDKVIKMFGPDMVYRGGLKIYTTLDTKMQKAAKNALATALDPEKGYLPTIKRAKGEDPIQPQVALISIDPRTGHIKAMIGGRGNDKFNRTTQALRQPGSAFKPIVYTAALEMGYSPGDVIDDIPGYFDPKNPNPWPTNYNDKYLGPISLREALTHSINVASVRLLNEIGIDPALKMAERLGISTIVKEGKVNDRNLGFALGGLTKGVSPIEMASAYGVFANKGIYVEPVAILKIEDSDGHVLYEANPTKRIVLQEDVAYLITDMLRSVVNKGTGWRAAIKGRQVAGKTGTTSDLKDAWFVGYTPDIVTSVWIGEDTPRPMIYDETDEEGNLLFSENGQPAKISSAEAARLWGEYMRAAMKDRPVLEFEKPDNIITVSIDPITGKLPNEYTPEVVTEIYREGNEPTEVEQLHQPTVKVAIDTVTGQLATPLCPKEQVEEYTYQRATGIRVGPATLTFTIKNKTEEAENTKPKKFIYVFKPGVPVIQINPETGTPITDKNGNYIYQYMPTIQCQEHLPSTPVEKIEAGAKKIIDTIWNFFKAEGNGE
ncbi:penicillin-binding protein [Anoxybacter fermentans]|uniref:Penicillin-binding protein 1A n=1 Tax=Anoxybacter fermentans TaxID=1323375 RepID=A0A3Q9HQR4_9FIRM|nr:penicillin-binding protein 1A [Anoxybacter fermentans]AZR73658.1 penicillin-binding protein [Anoxybacter fermentans]